MIHHLREFQVMRAEVIVTLLGVCAIVWVNYYFFWSSSRKRLPRRDVNAVLKL